MEDELNLDIKKKLSDELKRRRELLKKSQFSMANDIGIAPSTYGDWESGKSSPKAEFISILCSLFQCSADDLLGRTRHISGYRHYGNDGEVQWMALDTAKVAPNLVEVSDLGLRAFEAFVLERKTQFQVKRMPQFQEYPISVLVDAIQKALHLGILRVISVPDHKMLEDAMRREYSQLKFVKVANIAEFIDVPVIQTEIVAFYAVQVLQEILAKLTHIAQIGVGSGYTLSRIAELSAFSPRQFAGKTWIPLVSYEDEHEVIYSANYIASRLKHLHSNTQNIHLKYSKDHLEFNEAHYGLLNQSLSIVSVSGLSIHTASLEQDDISQFQAADDKMAVRSLLQQYRQLIALGKKEDIGGEILGRIVNKSGNEFELPNKGVSGLQLPQLRQIISREQLVLCVAAKAHKAQILKIAIEKGLVNALVIDREIAAELTRK